MSGKVIAVANMKGGVGKTALVIGLAEALATKRKRILVMDFDPQASASLCLAGDLELSVIIRNGWTVDAFLDDHFNGARRVKFDECIRPNISNVSHAGGPLDISLLASSNSLRTLEREIIFNLSGRDFGPNAIVGQTHDLMGRNLGRICEKFDFVIVDCPPGISVLSEVVIRLADLVLVPTIPDYLSTRGLQAFCRSMWADTGRSKAMQRPSRLPHVVISRRRSNKEHDEYEEWSRAVHRSDDAEFKVLKAVVPEKVSVARALRRTQKNDWPTFTSKWRDDMAVVLNDLATETGRVLNGR